MTAPSIINVIAMLPTPTPLPKTVYAIQHLAFEDLGVFEDLLYEFGLRVRYFEVGVDDLTPAMQYEGLTVILGGPISVYDIADYPYLLDEMSLLSQRLEQDKPTLGICLGAQLIAAALGAKVYPGHQKEIGWSQLQLTELPQGQANILTPLHGVEVLHWHGDSFDLPENAQLLASSEIYPHQAFQIGKQILALQFHLEVPADSTEKWLIGHNCELMHAKIDIGQLRSDYLKYADAMLNPAREIFVNYLNGLSIEA